MKQNPFLAVIASGVVGVSGTLIFAAGIFAVRRLIGKRTIMSKFINMPTLDQFAAECRKNAIETVRRSAVLYAREEAKQKVENARKQTRMAMERLDACGIEVSCCGNTYIHIDLGFFHSTQAPATRKLAKAVRGVFRKGKLSDAK